ncbi:TPA: DUF4365 domain-containing protein [Providencia rettgeri]
MENKNKNSESKEWMEYPKNSANGHAGEYHFAYWVSRYFNWPCRLISIDVGIDAQVEVFTEDKKSTGFFFGIQIKTTSIKQSVNVSLRHLCYWKSIDDPVILISVFFSEEQVPVIKWKHINDKDIDKLINKARRNKNNDIAININGMKELTGDSKYAWMDLLISHEEKEYIEKVKVLHDEIALDFKEILNEYKVNSTVNYIDNDIVYSINSIFNSFDEVELMSLYIKGITKLNSEIGKSYNSIDNDIDILISILDNYFNLVCYGLDKDIQYWGKPINKRIQNLAQKHGVYK